MSVTRYEPPDFTGLTLAEAWDLEDSLVEARGMLSAHIDEEIRRLTDEGWTQTQIAKECGRSQQAISRRQARLGIESVMARNPQPVLEPAQGLVPSQAVVEGSALPAHRIEDLVKDDKGLRDAVVDLCDASERVAGYLDGRSPLYYERELEYGLRATISVVNRTLERMGYGTD